MDSGHDEQPTGGVVDSRLTLCGDWQLSIGARTIALGRREQRVLAFLALDGPHPRARIGSALWPDATDRHALGNLRAAVWHLNRASPQVLEVGAGRLRLSRTMSVDVDELQRCAGEVRRAAQDGAPLRAVTDIKRVLLNSAELLPGWYDDWVLFERERLAQTRLRALETLAVHLISTGDIDGALATAGMAVAIEPFRESAHRALISAHLALGNYRDALRVYEQFRASLASALGVAPSARMSDLIRPLIANRRRRTGRGP